MSVSSATDTKSTASQAYDHFSWAAGLTAKAMMKTVSTIKLILSGGIDDNPPVLEEWKKQRQEKRILLQEKFDRYWTNHPSHRAMLDRIRTAFLHQAILPTEAKVGYLYPIIEE